MSANSQHIAEIENSIASLNATVATLLTEVARLSNNGSRPHHVMKTSIPLLPMQQAQPVRARPAKDMGRTPYVDMRRTESDDQKQQKARTPIPLSTILRDQEEVTFFVYTGKVDGQMVRTTACTTFDGTQLTVTQCDLVPSLVGMQTQKPGEILYRFIEELKNNGQIKRTFSVAPWKLCFVKRDGAEVTLDQLRANLEQSE